MKDYEAVRDELGRSMRNKFEDREKLRLKTFLYWKRNNLSNLSDGELSQEASRASLAEGSNASYTPDYVPGVGSPRSLALELERKWRKADISAEKIQRMAKQVKADYADGEV